MIQLRVTSTKFIAELQARARSFANQDVSATLMVPSDLAFWYWLEFGTAGRQDASAPLRSQWSGTYPIDPVNVEALAYPPFPGASQAEYFIKAHVNHPGIRPRAFVRTAIGELSKKGLNVTRDMLDLGFRLSVLKEAVFNAAEYDAKDAIAKELESAAPNTRADGKLDGNSAAEVFLEEAYVLDTSGGALVRTEAPRTAPSKSSAIRKGRQTQEFERTYGALLEGKTFKLFGKTVKASPYNHENIRPFLKTEDQIKGYFSSRNTALAEQKRNAMRHFFPRRRNS